jgi:hypothetical protein
MDIAKYGLVNLRKGGNNMATSSIFHNVRISDKKQAKAFVAALEACEKEGPLKTDRSFHTVNTDRELSKKLAEMRKKAREQK